MEDSNESDLNTKIIEKQYNNHIYNEKKGKFPFLLQFKQLKYYYNQRKKIKKKLQENELNPSKNIFVHNEYCFIDRKWFIKWKKHVGYKEIKNKIKKDKIERDLDNKDYKWISEIIDKNYKENFLNPLDNNIIYKDSEINPLADFKVVHLDSFNLFNKISQNSDVNNNFRKYPIRFFKDKFIVYIKNEMLLVKFKNIDFQKFNEIIVEFIDIKEKNTEDKSELEKIKGSKKKIIDILFNRDMNEWLKEIDYKFNEIECKLELENCTIKIYNKTLLRKAEEYQIRNNIDPNLNNERNELINSNILSDSLNTLIQFKSKLTQYYMRDFKFTGNNSKVSTNMVFKNDNEANNNNIIENNIIKSSGNINMKDLNNITTLMTKDLIFSSHSNKNKDNNIEDEPNNLDNDKKNNNNSVSNQNQTNISQNQNNINYNNNQNIIQNNPNNISSNYNNQNQVQDNNNNISQNNNNQIPSQNNNNFMNNNNNYINNNNISNNNFINNNNFTNNNNFINNNNFMNNINNFMNNFNNFMNNYNSFMNNNNNYSFMNFNNNFMNNNNNNQPNNNNQILVPNNAQNNIFQQNCLPFNFSQNNQYNNSLQNNHNNNNLMVNNYQQNFNPDNNYIMMMMNICQNLMDNQNNLNNSNLQNNNNSGLHYPHKSGLQNIGQTCYMNATIECLSNIKEVTDYLLNLNENFIPKEKNLTLSYRSLLIELFLSGQKCIVPEVFKCVIGELNPLFLGNHAADSKDLVFFIIERLHLELNNENKNIQNIQKDFFQLEIESRNEHQMLQNFFNDFKLKNNSIISETFYGITRSVMDCKGCGIKKFSFQSFNMQIFQLKKLKEDKVLYSQNYEKLNLIECFMLQQLPESLNNENMIYCNNCKGLKDGVHQQSIYKLPKVLIIILNRGRNNADFNEGFDFPAILDLRNQNVIIEQNSPHVFYLCGIITHLGESGSGGHFIAYCRNNQNDNFTFYNDSMVSQVSVESAISYKISNNENEKRTPYILFYHCI